MSKKPKDGSPIPPNDPYPTKKFGDGSGSTAYHIEMVPSAASELAAMPRREQGKVDRKITALASDPRPYGSVPLKGPRWQGHVRVRAGDWRIIYRVEDKRLTVLVIKIGHRKNVYK